MLHLTRNWGRSFGFWGLVAAGVVAGVLVAPPLRRGARRLAVRATQGILTINDEARKLVAEAQSGLQGLVAEARTAAAGTGEEVAAPEKSLVEG